MMTRLSDDDILCNRAVLDGQLQRIKPQQRLDDSFNKMFLS